MCVYCVSLLLGCKIQEHGNFCLIHGPVSNAWKDERLAHGRSSSNAGCADECGGGGKESRGEQQDVIHGVTQIGASAKTVRSKEHSG